MNEFLVKLFGYNYRVSILRTTNCILIHRPIFTDYFYSSNIDVKYFYKKVGLLSSLCASERSNLFSVAPGALIKAPIFFVSSAWGLKQTVSFFLVCDECRCAQHYIQVKYNSYCIFEYFSYLVYERFILLTIRGVV